MEKNCKLIKKFFIHFCFKHKKLFPEGILEKKTFLPFLVEQGFEDEQYGREGGSTKHSENIDLENSK